MKPFAVESAARRPIVRVPPAVVSIRREPPEIVTVPLPKLKLLFTELPRKVRVPVELWVMLLLFVSVMAAPLVLLIELAAAAFTNIPLPRAVAELMLSVPALSVVFPE